MSRYDECGTQARPEPIGGIAGTAFQNQAMTKECRPSLLNRLYEKRRQHEEMIVRISNTIRTLESNQSLVDVVEAVLAGREKADAPIFG